MYESSVTHFSEIAREKAGRLRRSPLGFFVAAMFAGAYIGIAMILALSCAIGLPAGVRPLVLGATFGLGLILSTFAGAELFTGYVMYVGFGLARKTISAADAVKLLVVVWFGNLAGALILSALFVLAGGGAVFADGGTYLAAYASHKVDASVIQLLSRAALCNWLVCLAIWTASRVASETAKCVVLAWTLLAFVAAGFEHSVANMTALTLGMFDASAHFDLVGVIRNLVVVTAGNIIGAAVLVVGGYLLAARTDREGESSRGLEAAPSLGNASMGKSPKFSQKL
ncbi:MAG: formate/nitrite transporter family protein [Burkholderiaceae bacterium]